MLHQKAMMKVDAKVSCIPQAIFVVYHNPISGHSSATWNQLLASACCDGKSLAAWVREGALVDGCARSYASFSEAAGVFARLGLMRMLDAQYDADAVVCLTFTTRNGSTGVMAVLQSAIPQAQLGPAGFSAGSSEPHWSEIMFEGNARRLPTTVYSANLATLRSAAHEVSQPGISTVGQ